MGQQPVTVLYIKVSGVLDGPDETGGSHVQPAGGSVLRPWAPRVMRPGLLDGAPPLPILACAFCAASMALRNSLAAVFRVILTSLAPKKSNGGTVQTDNARYSNAYAD